LSPAVTKKYIQEVEKGIGYIFREKELLREALTHKSFYHENREKAAFYNERLEFLGDSVIGLIVVEHLYLLKEKHSESVLAKMKSYLVCESVLADIASSLQLSRYLLDAGFEKTREIVGSFFRDRIQCAIQSGEFYDFKTELQERTQFLHGILPEYRVIRQQGEEHQRIFTVAVYLDGKRLGVASGRKKKEAEALAAQKALQRIRQ
jgi:ribonuclease-3